MAVSWTAVAVAGPSVGAVSYVEVVEMGLCVAVCSDETGVISEVSPSGENIEAHEYKDKLIASKRMARFLLDISLSQIQQVKFSIGINVDNLTNYTAYLPDSMIAPSLIFQGP